MTPMRGQALGTVVDAALRRELATADPEERPSVPTFSGGTGPRPGLDLASNRALHEVLDEGLDLDDRR